LNPPNSRVSLDTVPSSWPIKMVMREASSSASCYYYFHKLQQINVAQLCAETCVTLLART
jgi:hypothetical protein